ncbi:MAG: ABC transporter ATP-binding protein [Pseudomonadota bacterium]|nr:ABC transporter ATP-binding protein [Pseudomonadota bacterium]
MSANGAPAYPQGVGRGCNAAETPAATTTLSSRLRFSDQTNEPAGSRRYTPLLACRDLAVSIGGKQVVRGLNLALVPGQRLALLGRNGVGKTTLLHTLAGLRAPDAGEITLSGQTYAELGPRGAAKLRGLLPQHQGDAFAASVLETVLIGRHPHLSRWDWESTADEHLAREALAAVGLADLAARPIHTLSGGERQRVALATLLVQAPKLYLLDEPLAHLDLNHQIAVLELMNHRVREEVVTNPAALVMVLHDVNLAAHYSDQALLLYGEGEHQLGDSRTLLNATTLSRLYGHPLREMRDENSRWFVPEMSK